MMKFATTNVSCVRVTLLLCDAAQVADGKLYVLGGGWSLIGPDPTPSAVAIKVDVDWTEVDRTITGSFFSLMKTDSLFSRRRLMMHNRSRFVVTLRSVARRRFRKAVQSTLRLP